MKNTISIFKALVRRSLVFLIALLQFSFGTAQAFQQTAFWIGLKNSDDQGTRFDLRVEFYINEDLVATGETRCITGVTRNPNKAKEISISFAPTLDYVLVPGDTLSLGVLTRIGTNQDDTKCPGHNNAAGLRLYYDAIDRPSRFGAEIIPDPLTDFFLHSRTGDYFNSIPPTNFDAKHADSPAVNFAGGNEWQEISTWNWKVLPSWIVDPPELPAALVGMNNCTFPLLENQWDLHPDAGCWESPGPDGWIRQQYQKIHVASLPACDGGPGDGTAIRVCRDANNFVLDELSPCAIDPLVIGFDIESGGGGCARCVVNPTCH